VSEHECEHLKRSVHKKKKCRKSSLHFLAME
jgi:hypothetical protein